MVAGESVDERVCDGGCGRDERLRITGMFGHGPSAKPCRKGVRAEYLLESSQGTYPFSDAKFSGGVRSRSTMIQHPQNRSEKYGLVQYAPRVTCE